MRVSRAAAALLVLAILVVAFVAWRRMVASPAAPDTAGAAGATARAASPVGARAAARGPAIPDSVVSAPGVPGTNRAAGCGDGLWEHVYHPNRLLVKQDCVTVTGVIVDATAEQKHPRQDGVRKEADGDTHGWLRVDPEFANLINDGNKSDEGGNLVFEFVCHSTPSQADAKPVCRDYKDETKLPPVGTHVAITGTLVLDTNHGRWNELHPVSAIDIR